MAKHYVIELLPEEREELETMVRRGKAAARKLTRARVLLISDAGEQGPSWIDADIAEALGITTRCIEMLRKRAVEEGPLSAIERKPQVRPSVPKKFDGEKEAKLIALACSEPPAGHRRWSLRLLADKLVEIEVFASVSHERVREVMKKRVEAVAQADVVHSAQAERGVRLCHGKRAGRVPSALRSEASGGGHGRTAQAVDR